MGMVVEDRAVAGQCRAVSGSQWSENAVRDLERLKDGNARHLWKDQTHQHTTGWDNQCNVMCAGTWACSVPGTEACSAPGTEGAQLALYQEQKMAQEQAALNTNTNYHAAAEELGIWDNSGQGNNQSQQADTSAYATGYRAWTDKWYNQQWDEGYGAAAGYYTPAMVPVTETIMPPVQLQQTQGDTTNNAAPL